LVDDGRARGGHPSFPGPHQLDTVQGAVPCAVQNVETSEIILVAYVNEQALHRTAASRLVTFWSTSRNELWEKGADSGETFEVVDVLVNCEQNSLVYRVRPHRGGICHTKNAEGRLRNCFYRSLRLDSMRLQVLDP
jgi:phosphoribosyl-AMP cyclohydrolase